MIVNNMTNMNDSKVFRLPIGDWSEDGHSKCEWYKVSTQKTFLDVYKAYFKAVKKLGNKLDPCKFCSEYLDSELSKDVEEAIIAAGFSYNDWDGYVDPDWFAAYVCWFLEQGDPDLGLKILTDNEIPALISWYSPDGCEKINGFGYGLFD